MAFSLRQFLKQLQGGVKKAAVDTALSSLPLVREARLIQRTIPIERGLSRGFGGALQELDRQRLTPKDVLLGTAIPRTGRAVYRAINNPKAPEAYEVAYSQSRRQGIPKVPAIAVAGLAELAAPSFSDVNKPGKVAGQAARKVYKPVAKKVSSKFVQKWGKGMAKEAQGFFDEAAQYARKGVRYSLGSRKVSKIAQKADDVIDEKQVLEAMKQLRAGRIKPLVLDKAGNLLDGSHRLEAARRLKIDELPVAVESRVKTLRLDGKFAGSKSLKKIDPLAQEARKYKSAEEFVKAKTLYHGTTAKGVETQGLKTAKGRKYPFIQLYDEASDSSQYGKVLEVDASKLSILKATKGSVWEKRLFDVLDNPQKAPQFVKQLRESGYDAIKSADQTFVVRDISPNEFTSKSQLTDIYNQAKGFDPTNPQAGGINFGEIAKSIKNLGKKGRGLLEGKPGSSIGKTGQNIPEGTAGRLGRKLPQLAEPATIPKAQLPQAASPQLSSGGLQKTPSSPKLLPETDTAVNKLMAALKKAKPVRGQQEALYSAERAKRAGRAAAVGGRVPGEKGYIQQLSQLKGELPKKNFDEIRGQLGQADIDSLFNQVEAANMPVFEKITTKTGLSKILGGEVPTKGEISLLEEVFPQDFIKEVLSKRSLATKVLEGASDVLSIPRTLMSSIDLSAPLRQGVFLSGRPKQWAPAFKNMFKYFASEKAYQASIDQIRARPTYEAMRRSKLAIMEGGQVLTGREERFLSKFAEKLPGVRASNRAYTGFLNQLRADVFDDILKKAKANGNSSPLLEESLAKFVNAATGRGDLGVFSRSAGLLSQALFSPRLLASRLNLLNPRFYYKLEPTVRKEALKSLLTFAGMGTTVLTLANMAGAETGSDPRSADFGKIKVGNTRYDIWGGFQQPIRAAAQMITGESVSSTTGLPYKLGEGYKPTTRLDIGLRFLESKQSPVLGFIKGLISGENFVGDDFNVPEEIVNRFVPLVVQDLYELSQEPGQSAAMGIPAIFGVGTQTYGRKVPQLGLTPGGELSVKGTSPTGLSEAISNKFFAPKPQFDSELEEVKQLLQTGQISREDAKARLRQALLTDTVNKTNTNPELRKQLLPEYVKYLKENTKRQLSTVVNDYTLTTAEKEKRIKRILENLQQSAQDLNSL